MSQSIFKLAVPEYSDSSQLSTPSNVIISGIGMVSPLGQSAWETFRALLDGRVMTDRQAEIPAETPLVHRVRAIGCVKRVQHSPTDPAIELAEMAAREALTDANVDPRGLPCFVGTSKGCVGALCHAGFQFNQIDNSAYGQTPQDTQYAIALGPHGYFNHHLTKRLGVQIKANTIAACASSLTALDRARRYLLSQAAHDTVLVVTAEAALLDLFIHAYRRLGVLAPDSPTDHYAARPFSKDQYGFTLGEQAAAVVLRRVNHLPNTSQDSQQQSTHQNYAQLIDTLSLSDPHDLIRTNPEGEALNELTKRLLAPYRNTPEQNQSIPKLDALFAHAPGTRVHEQVELTAVENAIGYLPKVYGLKGAIGHGLGASGLMSLVVGCLSAKAKRLPPMPWLEDESTITVKTANHRSQLLDQHSSFAVLAAGFAGHTAGALLQS